MDFHDKYLRTQNIAINQQLIAINCSIKKTIKKTINIFNGTINKNKIYCILLAILFIAINCFRALSIHLSIINLIH